MSIAYTIRTARIEDLEILDRIHAANMKSYVERVYPWNDNLFRDRFIPEEYRIIEVKERVVGFFKIVTSTTDIYLAEIQILSQYQNRGIATSLLKLIIDRAKANHLKLWLKVIKGNPAEQLYRKLGFTVFEESPTHKKMQIT